MKTVIKGKIQILVMVMLLLQFPIKVIAQEYIVELKTTFDYHGNRRFQSVNLLYNFRTLIDLPNHFKWDADVLKNLSNSVNSTTYYKLTKGSYIGLQFDYQDFRAGSGTFLDMLYYNINSPTTYTGQSYYDQIYLGWPLFKTHTGRISFDVTAYDVPTITKVEYSGCSSETCVGSSMCIENNTDIIKFTLTATNPGSASLRIYACDKNGNELGYYDVGAYATATTKDVAFSSLSLQNYFGEEIKFKVRSSLGGQLAMGSTYSPTYIFSKRIPAPTSKSTTRTACLDEIVLTMPAGIAANHANYRFVWVGTQDIQLTSYYRGGNNIYLRNNSTAFPTGASSIAVQIADKENLNCARNISVSFDIKPSALALTATPISYKFNDTIYHITKNGANDGQVRISVVGNPFKVSGFQYSYDQEDWYTPTTLFGINYGSYVYKSLHPNATYYLRVFDLDGCPSNPVSFGPLKEPKPFLMGNIFIDTVTCHINNLLAAGGSHTGAIYASWSGGIGPFTATIKHSSGNPNVKISGIYAYSCQQAGLPAGNYTVIIQDVNKYTVQKTTELASHPPLILNATLYPLSCFNDGSGKIQLNLQNKLTSTVDFELSGQPVRHDVVDDFATWDNLNAGNYLATVTNENGCVDTLNAVITQPSDIEITAIGSKIAEYGGSTGTINLSIEGGTGGFNYSVLKNKTIINSGNTTENALISGLYDGYYKIRVIDENNCLDSLLNIRVRQPDSALTLSYTKKNVDCYGNSTGQVFPIAKGGWRHYKYGFNNTILGSTALINGLSASGSNIDTVFVIDSADVIAKASVVITQPTQLLTSIATVSNLNCYNDNSGAVKLNISGGTPNYQVSADNSNWTTGDFISGLSAGSNQTIFARDANKCPSTESVSITQPAMLIVAEDTVIDAQCQQNTGAIQTIISGGTEEYFFKWYFADSSKYMGVNSGMLENIYSGQYLLFVTDKNLCKDTLIVSVSDINGPKLSAYSIDSVSCFGGKDGIIHIIDVSGGFPGYKYYIDGTETSPEITGLSGKNYYFRLLDSKGCKIDSNFIVPQPKAIEISGQTTNPVCYNSFDGSITTSVTGGNGQYSYLWSNNSKTANLFNLNKGNLKLTVIDRKGCKLDKSFAITTPAAPTANLKQNPSILCTGNTIQLDGGDFVSYRWYKDNSLVSTERYLTLSEAGSYTLKIANDLGCIGIDTLNLKVSDHPLDAVLLVQDSAVIDEVIKVVDVTWPVPDSIQWYFDKPVTLDDNNSWMQKFHTDNEGIVNVTLRAWYGGCFSDSSKTVTIYYEDGFIPQKIASFLPLILGFKAYPNPNEGNFYIAVKLSREADVTLKLYNSYTSVLEDVQYFTGLEEYEIPYNLTGLNSGVYVLELSSENERQVLKVVIE